MTPNAQTVCQHCLLPGDKHAGTKCLYTPQTFEPLRCPLCQGRVFTGSLVLQMDDAYYHKTCVKPITSSSLDANTWEPP